MLKHFTIGPTESGRFLVAYMTPGCNVPTVTDDCSGALQAMTQCNARNIEQVQRENTLRWHMRLLGNHDYVYRDLDDA